MSTKKIRQLTRGSLEQFTFTLTQKDENGITTPFDLTGIDAAEITACFKVKAIRVDKTAGDITIDDITGGKISTSLTSTDMDGFEAENFMDVEIKLDDGGLGATTKRWQAIKCFKVNDRICD